MRDEPGSDSDADESEEWEDDDDCDDEAYSEEDESDELKKENKLLFEVCKFKPMGSSNPGNIRGGSKHNHSKTLITGYAIGGRSGHWDCKF